MLKIAIVDDHQLIIEGLNLLLENQPEIQIVQSFLSAQEFLDFLAVNPHSVDMVLLDLQMPVMSGYNCAVILRNNFPYIKIAILSMESDAKIIDKLINEIGINAFLSKGSTKKQLLDAIYQVAHHNLYLSDDIEKILSGYRRKLIETEEIKLTVREKQIVNLMCSGLTNEQIAAMLFISEFTVATHRKNIYRKTETHNIGQLNEKMRNVPLH